MKRRVFAFLTAAMLLAMLVSGCAGNAGDRARSGVARILTIYDVYDYETEQYLGQQAATGTGFGVGKAGKETDVFATNLHVVSEIELMKSDDGRILQLQRSAVYILKDNFAFSNSNGLDTSRAEPCSVIYGSDDNGVDIAILRTAKPVEGRVALPLKKTEEKLHVDEEVTALGYPGSSDLATSEGYMLAGVDDVTVTSGKVSRFYEPSSVSSAAGMLENNRYIQHTAPVNHGNSGGPLIDRNGAVVGVNTNIVQSQQYGETTAYYALRIQYVKDALDDLKIAYDETDGNQTILLIAGIAAVAAVLIVVLVLVLKRKTSTNGGGTTDQTSDTSSVGPVQPQPGIYRIQAVSGAFAGRRFAVNGQVRIGTDPSQNDLVFPAGTKGVSRVHCVVIEQNGLLYLRDAGSTYGTFLAGGQRLAPNQPVQVRIGDRFSLGSPAEQFQVTGKGGI